MDEPSRYVVSLHPLKDSWTSFLWPKHSLANFIVFRFILSLVNTKQSVLFFFSEVAEQLGRISLADKRVACKV